MLKRNIVIRNQEHRLSSRHIGAEVKKKAEIKLAVLVIIVISLFFLSWTPYAIVALLGIFGKKELITPIVSMVPALFCKTAACVNPFIYIISHPKFRREFKKIMKPNQLRELYRSRNELDYAETINIHGSNRDLNDDLIVEVVQLNEIPYMRTENNEHETIQTISGKIDKCEELKKY